MYLMTCLHLHISRHFDSRQSETVDMRVDILGTVDIMGVDILGIHILGVDIPALPIYLISVLSIFCPPMFCTPIQPFKQRTNRDHCSKRVFITES